MNTTEDRTARAALTRLFEPGDIVGRALVAKHGAAPRWRSPPAHSPLSRSGMSRPRSWLRACAAGRRGSRTCTRKRTWPSSNVWAADSSLPTTSTGPQG
jgi:hypothetical protein